MTRQHFAAIAAVLAAEFPVALMADGSPKPYDLRTNWEKGAYDLWNTLRMNMTNECARWNPNFNTGKFTAACFPASS